MDRRSMVTGSAIVFVLLRRYSDCSVSLKAALPNSNAVWLISAFGGIAHPDRTCAGSTRSGRTQSGH